MKLSSGIFYNFNLLTDAADPCLFIFVYAFISIICCKHKYESIKSVKMKTHNIHITFSVRRSLNIVKLLNQGLSWLKWIC